MKRAIVPLLACIECGGALALTPAAAAAAAAATGDAVEEGALACACGAWYPVLRGVPRLLGREADGARREYLARHPEARDLPGPLAPPIPGTTAAGALPPSDEEQARTCAAFGNKWNAHPRFGFTPQTRDLMFGWIAEKYGWRDLDGLRRELAPCRHVLEVGAGTGRDMAIFSEANPAAEIFGLELSDAVDRTAENLRPFPHAHAIQADLQRPPFRRGAFDYIFAEGVLHHTPDTRRSFLGLVPYLAPHGMIAVYVYARKGPVREFCDDLLRTEARKLTPDECWRFAAAITRFGQTLAGLKATVELAEPIPALGIPAGRFDVQRIFYAYMFKCYWNDGLTFDENNLVNFDWYSPGYAHRHTAAEVRGWFAEAGLAVNHFHTQESGYTVKARRTDARQSGFVNRPCTSS